MASDARVAVLLQQGHEPAQLSLSARLALPLLEQTQIRHQADFALSFSKHGALQLQQVSTGVCISASFFERRLQYRLRQGLKQEMLLRAVGCKGSETPSVIDATGGLGQDALLMAAAGCHVTLIERSPLLHALLEHAIETAVGGEDTLLRAAAQRLHLLLGESRQQIPELPSTRVIYLDPMFPERRKSASVGKNMALLQQLLPQASVCEVTQLLDCARQHAGNRVVVKRPRLAPVIAGHQPGWQITGRSSRFDVYLPAS